MKKVAFITGASRGIGASTALYFAQCGYDVAINYLNSKEKAEQIRLRQEYLKLFRAGFKQQLDSIKVVKEYKEDENN